MFNKKKYPGHGSLASKKEGDVMQVAKPVLAPKTKKASAKKEKKLGPEIFEWPHFSSRMTAGRQAVYRTLLHDDGRLTCNCMGWIFKKKGATERRCKHTDLVQEEAKQLFKDYKLGKELPRLDPAQLEEGHIQTIRTKDGKPKHLQHGRALNLD